MGSRRNVAAVNDRDLGAWMRTTELGTWLRSLDGPQIAARLNEEQFQRVAFEHPLFDNRKKS
jgi:hypothetical protein